MATVLVTGANRGIGLELCRQFKQRGDHVIAVCRKPSHEIEALKVRVELHIDLANDTCGTELVQRLKDQSIDVLVNNAGVLTRDSLDSLNFDSIRQSFEINTLGPLRVTAALLPKMRAGSKVIFMTSRMGSIGDNTSGGYYAYRMSKAALNMAGTSLAHDLKSRKISVAILHPGYVQTGMTGFSGDATPEEAATRLLQRIDALTLGASGTFWHANGENLPW